MKRTFIPNVGFEYELGNKTIIVQLIAITKGNSKFDDTHLKYFIKETSKYFDSILKSEKPYANLFGKIKLDSISENIESLVFRKFISKEIHDNFINKGHFQLGSLKKYREIERKESRDEREGFSNIIINSGTKQVITSVISGFNHYILCGTHTLDNAKYLTNNFGGLIMEIKNIKSFADKIKNKIGAKTWYIQKIQYTDYKAFSIDNEIQELTGASPDLSEEVFHILHAASHLPSIFSKPISFSPENELRLTFEMEDKVEKDLHFTDISLLEEITIKQCNFP